jgi:hypothetical protein
LIQSIFEVGAFIGALIGAFLRSVRLLSHRYSAAGQDVALVRCEVVDASGRVVPNAGYNVTFTVGGSGSAEVYGVGNGDPANLTPDKVGRKDLPYGGKWVIPAGNPFFRPSFPIPFLSTSFCCLARHLCRTTPSALVEGTCPVLQCDVPSRWWLEVVVPSEVVVPKVVVVHLVVVVLPVVVVSAVVVGGGEVRGN